MTLFFAPCFFQVHTLDWIFFKVPDPKKLSGRPDKLEKWVQIDWTVVWKKFVVSPKSKILIFILQLAATSPTFVDGQRAHRTDRNGVLNGSTRSLASNHPMLAGATTTTTSASAAAAAAASAAAAGGLGGGGGFGGGHYNGQSPVGETLRHHLTSEGTSLSTKVHTVILSGNIPQWSLGLH